MCLGKTFNICDCPPTISFDDLPLKPGMRTPLDRLGFPQRCCWCCSLKCATIIICIVSFIWAAYELQSAEKFMASMFQSRSEAFYYCKALYLLWIICFLVACGVLLLGIIVQRFELVTLYVWYMFIFCCSYFIIIIGGTIISVLATGSLTKKDTFRVVVAIIWTSVFFYFIIIVNSYKITLW